LNHFSDGNLDAIYDVTIAYPDNLPEREEDLKKGKLPKEVHFYIKRYFFIKKIYKNKLLRLPYHLKILVKK